jgi:LPXTG-motif cell wall-anchored protein
MPVSTSRPSRLRATTAKLAVGGVAGLASLMVLAPAALADDTPPPTDTGQTPDPSTTDPTTGEDPGTPGDETTDPTTDPGDPTDGPTGPGDPSETPGRAPGVESRKAPSTAGMQAEVQAEEVAPNFGLQKYRIGVQVADGSYVPAGTTTAGTKITITESNPAFEGGSHTFTCTTDASTQQPGSTATYCFGSLPFPTMAKKAAAAGVTVEPDPSIPFSQMFLAVPGSTVTITQTTVMPNLVRDTTTATIPPCSPDGEENVCGGSKVLFNDPGLPPVAVDDKATTREGHAVDIAVLDNDDPVNGAPITGPSVKTDPDHGTAAVNGEEITYTPDDGFTGTDTFDYAYTTPNGSATATVTVRVRPEAAVSDEGDQVLPDTGGADPRLLGYAALLLAAGGWLTARGRRRPQRAHAPTD